MKIQKLIVGILNMVVGTVQVLISTVSLLFMTVGCVGIAMILVPFVAIVGVIVVALFVL